MRTPPTSGPIAAPAAKPALQIPIAVGAWSRATEPPDAIVERFGRLAEAGVQHVIVNFAEANDPALIELLGSKVLPQLRGVEAADPRHLAVIG